MSIIIIISNAVNTIFIKLIIHRLQVPTTYLFLAHMQEKLDRLVS